MSYGYPHRKKKPTSMTDETDSFSKDMEPRQRRGHSSQMLNMKHAGAPDPNRHRLSTHMRALPSSAAPSAQCAVCLAAFDACKSPPRSPLSIGSTSPMLRRRDVRSNGQQLRVVAPAILQSDASIQANVRGTGRRKESSRPQGASGGDGQEGRVRTQQVRASYS